MQDNKKAFRNVNRKAFKVAPTPRVKYQPLLFEETGYLQHH